MKLKVALYGENGNYATQEVNGEIIENEFVKAIVHKNIEHPDYWAISEYYTGCGLVGYGSFELFKNKQAAIDDFNTRSANAQYVPDPEVRKKYLKEMIDGFVKDHGFTNA